MVGTAQADQTFSKERQIVSRWGHPIADDYGYVDIPGWILRNYHKCGVTPLEMMFVTHVMAFKYDRKVDNPENPAKPSLPTIADYMGRDTSNVRRLKQSLIRKKMLTVTSSKGKADEYNFAGLTNACLKFEMEARQTPSKTTTGKNTRGTDTTGKITTPVPPVNLPAEDSEVSKDSESNTSLHPAAGASDATGATDAPDKAVAPPSKQESVEPVKDGLKALAEKGRKPKEHKPPDPVFRWVCDYLGVNPDVAWNSKSHDAFPMKGYIVAEEKARLKQAAPLADDQLTAAAAALDGFIPWYRKECKDCAMPKYRKFQTWIGKWYKAGRPGANVQAKWEFDPMTGWKEPTHAK